MTYGESNGHVPDDVNSERVAGDVGQFTHGRLIAADWRFLDRSSSTHYGRGALLIAGPKVWNSLHDELRDPACGSDSFKQFLKTILFSLY